jgi:hypothetical protein
LDDPNYPGGGRRRGYKLILGLAAENDNSLEIPLNLETVHQLLFRVRRTPQRPSRVQVN